MKSQAGLIETATRVAPFGVRFFDPVTRRYVADLLVVARPADKPGRQLPLFANRSGVFVLTGVPGLREFEFGSGDESFWANMPAPTPYEVYVNDPLRRYLPFRFEASVPTRGLSRWQCGPCLSPDEPADIDVPLYSAPRRSAPEGMAIVRADLYDPITQRPAAWSVVEVNYDGRLLGQGIADERGSMAAILPHPPPVDYMPASPSTTGRSLSEQEWVLDLRFGYAPAAEAPHVLDLCASLEQLQLPLATAWYDAQRTIPLTTATLHYGRELILRSFDRGKPMPYLLVTPAVSPP